MQASELTKHQGLIRAVIWRSCGTTVSAQDVEDMVQNVNLRLLETGLANFDPERGSPEAYITVMTKSMTIDHWRRVKRRPIAMSEQMDESESGFRHVNEDEFKASYMAANSLEEQSDDALTLYLRDEQRSVLDSVIKELSLDDQHFLLVSMQDDFSYKDYAKRLNVSDVSLRVRRYRIGNRIKELLAVTKS